MAVGVAKVLAFVAVTAILLHVVVFTALGAVSARYWSRYDGRGLNEPWFLSSSIAMLAVTLFVCFLFLRYVDREDWSFIRFKARRSPRLFAMGIVLSLIAVVLFVAVAISAGVVQIRVTGSAPWRMVFYLLLALVGGFALVVQEELLFRGYLFRTLEVSLNRPVAVVATSVLFGLFHLTMAHASLLGIVNIFLMGCLLALVCVQSGSLWSAIGGHFGWNFLLYCFNFPVSGARYPNPFLALEYKRYSLIGGSAFGPEDSAVVTVLLALALVGALMWLRKQRDAEGRRGEIR
jgi:membrane protease YdiL (CAAX protease family)